MENTNDKRKEKVIKAIQDGKIKDDTTFNVFQMIEDLNDRLDNEIPQIKDVISRVKGDKGDKPEVGIDFKQPKDGEPGKDGENYVLTEEDKKEIAKSIKVPVVEKEVKTIVEKTEVVRIEPLVTENIVEKAIYEEPDQIIAKVNSAKKLIDSSKIKGFADLEKIAKINAFNPTMGPSFSDLIKKQDKLIAGSGITITGNTISSSGGGGSGTVTSVSVVSANGLAGTVATATTTPAITLSTTITGILQGNGTAISAATTTGSGSVVLGTTPTLATPVINGLPTGTGVASTATASTLVSRDANANIFINNHFSNNNSVVSASGTTVLTIASARNQVLTGTLSQTFQLPDATTLTPSHTFTFNNNSSGSLIINNTGSVAQYTVPAGGYVECHVTDVSTANGVWDFHPLPPKTVTWGSGVTGLVFNTALTTSPSISAGISSAANPSFIPQRGSATTGYGGDSTNLYGSIGGSAVFTATATSFTGVGTITGTQHISTIATGTAPLVVTSTTPVANLSIGGNAATATNVAVGGITGLGTGVATALALNVGSAGAPVVFNGALGTPSSGTLTNATGLPAAGVVGTAAVLGGNTFTAKNTMAGIDEVGKTYAPASGAQTVALDCTLNNTHIVTGNASGTAITFTVTGATNSQPFIVSILQGAVVSTISGWFATVRWAGGTTPILTATVGKRDTFGFIRTGANTYDGFIIGQNC